VRAPARLVKVWKETVARLVRVSGRQAERCHDRHVRDLRPLALEFDEQWSFVKTSTNAAPTMNGGKRATCGSIPPWPLPASGGCP
jgi:hypothetical protein